MGVEHRSLQNFTSATHALYARVAAWTLPDFDTEPEMTMTNATPPQNKRSTWLRAGIALAVAGALAAGIGAATPLAREAWAIREDFAGGGPGAHRWFRAHLDAHIDDALDAVKANAAQRRAVAAARDHVLAVADETRKARFADAEGALELFGADRIDNQLVEAARARHQAQVARLGDAIVQAFYDVHDAFTPAQRRALADYVRDELPKGGGKRGGLRERIVRRILDAKVEEALDYLNATAAQRQKIAAVKDRTIDAIQAERPDHAALVERVLTLFTADTIDKQAVAALRADAEARLGRVADSVVKAFVDVHDTLDAAQRKQAVTRLRALRRAHGRHHG
jgi:Spy/CpxP family protein refolding chaperone